MKKRARDECGGWGPKHRQGKVGQRFGFENGKAKKFEAMSGAGRYIN